MNLKELYTELIQAYSDNNLNIVSGKIIALYKNKNYEKLQEIANKISKYVTIDEDQLPKLFSKLIVLYHPDKGDGYRKKLTQYYKNNDLESLQSYSHILSINDLENTTVTSLDESVDYQPEYSWEAEEKAGDYFYDVDDTGPGREDINLDDYEKSFYNEVKFRVYGDPTIEFPPYYLEDFEEYELAECGLESLDGVQYCIHATVLDFSDNLLTDISELGKLERLEEIYLANNQIGYIDALSNLFELKVIDLSNNLIDDISPLFDLKKLSYVNLSNNPVPISQINQLKRKGMVVIS
ncbi:leucine-rich repeat domain-containing protein [Parvicella tangerina]|uniref:Leucine-rich repeat domain-containing protein n=1 Tax=Parvicella tangerina TaxID=2829795 RepID=A0A916JMP2_9FLAO|nr:leucine-rich repeat domain-containing protein [Parvicella tangerina]CAG5082356.1 hypothetical protein CRYO30217_01889 [Parvicella tangerina]